MHGDMLDRLYRYVARDLNRTSFYATCFEFATMGDTPLASIRSLRAVMLENQAHWNGVKGAHTAERVRTAFDALFFPREAGWRQRALSLAREALAGILEAEGFTASSRA